MAVVWANQAARWENTAIWSYWNEATQSIQLYGRVPQSDDIVYLNGYTVDGRFTDCYAKELHNGLNPYTSQGNGQLQVTMGCVYVFDCHHEGNVALLTTNGAGATINGNIFRKSQTQTFATTSNGYWGNLLINGSVLNDDGISETFVLSNAGYRLGITINGNCSIPQSTLATNTNAANSHITINGNCECLRPHPEGNDTITTYCSGILKVNRYSDAIINCNTINYEDFNLTLSRITPIDADTFKIIYVGSEPNPNVYRIITQYDLNNRQQYPAESDVKLGTEYAWGEKVGTFEPNYPPESVVMQGYEYADGEMTGTLEPIEVNASNTINVYPFKRRT